MTATSWTPRQAIINGATEYSGKVGLKWGERISPKSGTISDVFATLTVLDARTPQDAVNSLAAVPLVTWRIPTEKATEGEFTTQWQFKPSMPGVRAAILYAFCRGLAMPAGLTDDAIVSHKAALGIVAEAPAEPVAEPVKQAKVRKPKVEAAAAETV